VKAIRRKIPMTKQITITLADETLTKLDAICASSGYSRSEQIEGMISADYETMPTKALHYGRDFTAREDTVAPASIDVRVDGTCVAHYEDEPDHEYASLADCGVAEFEVTAARATEIIAEERASYESLGPVACLVVTDDGRLADDQYSESLARTEMGVRAQVRAWLSLCH